MKKKFVVDVFRTVAQTIPVEAETEEEALEIAANLAGDIVWSMDMLTDDVDVDVCGEYDENGEVQYNC